MANASVNATELPPIPSHVPPDLVRTYPFRRGKVSERRAEEIVDEIHATYPPAFFVQDLYPGKSGWIFRRAEDIRSIFMDIEHFSLRGTSPFGPLSGGDWHMVPNEATNDKHIFYRSVINPLLAPKRMAALEDELRDVARSYISKFADRGHCDLIVEFTLEFPIKVFLKLIGLPLEQAPMFLAWEEGLIKAPNLEKMGVAANAVVDYMKEAIADRKKNPSDDLISHAIQAEVRGKRLDDSEIIGLCFTLFIGGLDTVSSHMGRQFLYLAEHPELQQQLRENPELIPAAIDELMRAFGSVSTAARVCTKEQTVAGVLVKPGDRIHLSTPLAGRDPEAYENPGEVRLDRKPQHVSFGHGPHLCVGIHLAKRELRIGMEEMLRMVPQFRVAPDAKIITDIGSVVQLLELPLVWEPRTA
jgi:cytochrome P450